MPSVRESVELEGLFAFSLLQLAVDAQLDAPNRQQLILVSVLPDLTSSPIRNCHFQTPGVAVVVTT